jgi:hypothetical protein
MKRRGELTSEQIIAIVLAIIGFIIIIAFATQLGTEDYSTDEICRLSVLSRATAAEVVSGVQQGLPLKCSTKKVCLTATKEGDCDQFIGEKDVVNVQLPAVKDALSAEQQATEISKIMAQSMYDCWNIMGEGKLDLFSNAAERVGFSQKDSTCVVCSRVALATDIPQDVIGQIDVSKYMEKATIPGSTQTYLEALSDGVSSTYSTIKNDGTIKENNDIVIGGTNTNEMAFVFMQIKSQSLPDVFATQAEILGAVTGGAFIARPSSILSAGRFLFSTSGLVVAGVAVAAVGGTAAYNTLRNQDVAVGYCGQFTSKDKAAKGCSLLQGIPYSVKDIRNLCGTLEGNI